MPVRSGENHLSALERLFLVRRLPAWHPNDARRLVKAPKVHVVDSGFAATLAGLSADDWIQNRERFGHILDSFVLHQIVAQAGWTDTDLRFWHYRDKDQVEVDVVITRGRQVWGVEVKAGATVTAGDGHGLRRLAEQSGKNFQCGVILYAGTSTLHGRPTDSGRSARGAVDHLRLGGARGSTPREPFLYYDVTRDGKKFFVAEDPNPGVSSHVDVVVNWFSEVTREVQEARVT